jgi:hypothetical protein
MSGKKFFDRPMRKLLIDDEIEKGILPDPNAPVDEAGNPIQEPGMEGGVPPEEVPPEEVPPEEVPPKEPKGGKI